MKKLVLSLWCMCITGSLLTAAPTTSPEDPNVQPPANWQAAPQFLREQLDKMYLQVGHILQGLTPIQLTQYICIIHPDGYRQPAMLHFSDKRSFLNTYDTGYMGLWILYDTVTIERNDGKKLARGLYQIILQNLTPDDIVKYQSYFAVTREDSSQGCFSANSLLAYDSIRDDFYWNCPFRERFTFKSFYFDSMIVE